VVEGDDAAFRFRVSDHATGQPLAGAYPAAWIDPLKAGEAADFHCLGKVEEFIGGDLFHRPSVDLNAYYVLALNPDATISVVDPLFGFGGTKLLAMVELDSPGEDWVLSGDRTRLFVSLPDSGKVAVVDAGTWKVTAKLDAGSGPRRLALQPDGAYLWVAVEGGVAAVRTSDLTVAARIVTGAGSHDLAVSDDSRFVFVTNGEARTLSVIGVSGLAKVRDVPLGAAPSAVAYSPLGRTAWVTSEEDGSISVVGPEGTEPAARIQAAPGLGPLRFAPGGRLAFVPNPRTNRVHIVDASSNRIVQTAEIDGGPEQIYFSDTLAYIRRRASEIFLMIPLGQIGEPGRQVPIVDAPGGQNPLGKVSRPSPAASIVRAPGATAVLVANPADRAIYFYKEGMAAPMGSFSNYDREPRAVLVIDRSLKELKPGVYETVARAPLPGRYRVAFFLDAPRMVQCFELTVAAHPELEAKRRRESPARAEALIETRRTAARQPVRLRFRLADPNTGQPLDGLEDVQIMLYRSPGNWQDRRAARQVAPGIYEAEIVPPEPGQYKAVVECKSWRLPFHKSPAASLEVTSMGAAPSP